MTVVPFDDDGKNRPPKKQSKYDEIIEHLFFVLPADSYQEMSERLIQRDLNVTVGTIRNVVHHLRKNAEIYRWKIPYAKQGPGEREYYAMIMDEDGSFYADPDFRASVDSGNLSMLQRTITEITGIAVTCRAAAAAEGGLKPLRDFYEDLAEYGEFSIKRAKRLLRKMQQASNGE